MSGKSDNGDAAQRRYEEWAKREAAKGDQEKADRLHKKAEAIGRTHGSGSSYGSGGPTGKSGGGCAVLIMVGMGAMGAAGTVILRAWEAFA